MSDDHDHGAHAAIEVADTPNEFEILETAPDLADGTRDDFDATLDGPGFPLGDFVSGDLNVDVSIASAGR